MPNVSDVLRVISEFAPVELAVKGDYVGLLVGRMQGEVTRVLCALDVTRAVIDEAVTLGAELIVTHHPSYRGLDRLTDFDPMDERVLRLAEAKIAHIAMHTNADIASGGVNDCLAELIGLHNVSSIPDTEDCCRIGIIDECDLAGFARLVRDKLHARGVRYADCGKKVRRVAVGGGGCAGFIDAVMRCGADTFLLGDAKYHDFMRARHAGINLVEAGHFATEDIITPVFARLIADAFPTLCVTTSLAIEDSVQWLE